MYTLKKVLSFFLVLSLIASILCGCSVASDPNTESDTSSIGTTTSSSIPEVSITVIDETQEPTEKETAMAEYTHVNDTSISSLVYSAVNYDLQSKGFDTHSCIAAADDVSYTEYGIGYYEQDFQLFDKNEYASVGFLTVVNSDEKVTPIPSACEYIAVEPIDGTFNNCNAKYHLLAYSCDDIAPGHFVYKDKYVVYYQQDATTVRYKTYENVRDNYDLSLGSLYDFDHDAFIYDADLFDGYETHSAIELFSDEDYEQLQHELQQMAELQEANGYNVEELNIVYISPESIEAYLASEEEDTFFGYSVSELEKSIGRGTALVYTGNGFEEAKNYDTNPEDYNWK